MAALLGLSFTNATNAAADSGSRRSTTIKIDEDINVKQIQIKLIANMVFIFCVWLTFIGFEMGIVHNHVFFLEYKIS